MEAEVRVGPAIGGRSMHHGSESGGEAVGLSALRVVHQAGEEDPGAETGPVAAEDGNDQQWILWAVRLLNVSASGIARSGGGLESSRFRREGSVRHDLYLIAGRGDRTEEQCAETIFADFRQEDNGSVELLVSQGFGVGEILMPLLLDGKDLLHLLRGAWQFGQLRLRFFELVFGQ